MPIEVVAEQTITVGELVSIEGASPSQPFGIVFEDDGETAYLYGLDFRKEGNPIVDALCIYNVADVDDRTTPSHVQLAWSSDGLKSVLLINGYPHAVFDFESQRGYCRTGFPPSNEQWTQYSHEWSEEVDELFR